MRTRILWVVISGLLAGSANGAILFLQNAADGTGSMDLGFNEVGSMNIMLEMEANDTNFAFATVFLDDADNLGDGQLEVVEVIAGFEGPDITYDRSAFTLPADVSHFLNNEYGLIMGRTDGDGWGTGTYVLDTLEFLNTSDEPGEHPITFEGGARQPLVYTADFHIFVWNTGFHAIIPNMMDPGIGGAGNPFIINTNPEPATAVLLALGGLGLLRRRKRVGL